MRFKWLREGIVDYEYIEKLRLIDESIANNILHQVARNMVDWEINPDVLDETRQEIGNIIDREFIAF